MSEDSTQQKNIETLDTAEEHIQLAVDLIYLLESNEMPAETVLKALDIVSVDFKQKLKKS